MGARGEKWGHNTVPRLEWLVRPKECMPKAVDRPSKMNGFRLEPKWLRFCRGDARTQAPRVSLAQLIACTTCNLITVHRCRGLRALAVPHCDHFVRC